MLTALAALSCISLGGNARKAAHAKCQSDKDCLYGLVCTGTDPGVSGERRCTYEQYATCSATWQCAPGRTCREGSCEVQCVVDADCRRASADGGFASEDVEAKCVVGECQLGENSKVCEADGDCERDQTCLAGRCAAVNPQPCEKDSDCVSGEQCFGGQCR